MIRIRLFSLLILCSVGWPQHTALLERPNSVVSDPVTGNTYISAGPNRVLVLSREGAFRRVPGFVKPEGLALDSAGNLYVADSAGNRVRRLGLDGSITLIAGNGNPGHAGDGGLAPLAELNAPTLLASDAKGSLYIVDSNNLTVRRVNPQGVISTMTARGQTQSPFQAISGLAAGPDGALYIADSKAHSVFKLSHGVTSILAGTGTAGREGDGGPASKASLNSPHGLALDSVGNLYIADTGNHSVRRVSAADGSITTVAGTGIPGDYGDGGQASGARLSSPTSLATDESGNLYIVTANKIRVLSGGIIRTLVPGSPSSAGPSPRTTAPPAAPVLISPQNGAFGVANAPSLHWNDTAGASSYDVYFGTSPSPPFLATTPATFYGPMLLGPGVFYWRVVAKNSGGSTTSATWSFTTSGGTPPMLCDARSAAPPVRSEGATELIGDIVLTCSGGTAVTPGTGTPLSTADITVSLVPRITSRLLNTEFPPDVSEALLLIDEPGSSLPAPAPGWGPQSPQALCPTPLNGAGPGGCVQYAQQVGGVTVMSSSPGTASQPDNVFEGVWNPAQPNQITFPGVPILPAPTGSRIYRITNIRANIAALGTVADGTPVTATINILNNNNIAVSDPAVNVALIQRGLNGVLRDPSNAGALPAGGADFAQCQAQGAPPVAIGTLQFTETFAADWKTRVTPASNGLGSGQAGPGTALQNVPGSIYVSESGFIPAASVGSGLTGNGAFAGFADYGTRLKATLRGIPTGVRIFVSTTDVPNANTPNSSAPKAALVTAETLPDNNGSIPAMASTTTTGSGVPVAELAVDGSGNASATWEVLTAAPVNLETLNFGLYLQYPANAPAIPAGQNGLTATLDPSFAPAAAATASIPRFADLSAARNLFAVSTCQSASPVLSINKTHVGSFTQSQTGAAYAVTVTNRVGAATTSGTVTVSDALPVGLTLVSMAGAGWNCAGNSCTRSDGLAGGSSYPAITVTVNVDSNAPAALANQATVSGGGSVSATASDPTSVLALPGAFSLLSPANGTSGVGSNLTLTWSPSAGAVSYDVFFGSATQPPLVTNSAGTQYSPSGIASGSTYFWRIVAKNQAGTLSSPVFSFTTAVCTFSLTPPAAAAISEGGSNSVQVLTQPGCPWTAQSNANWLVIAQGTAGTGSGSVNYTVAPNSSVNRRSGTATIGGQTFTVNQDGVPASFNLSPPSINVPAGANNGTVSVTASPQDAPWTAVSTASWLTITSGASGAGNGTVAFSVAANGTGAPRVGTLTIAGQTFTVNQSSSTSACVFSINPPGANLDSGSGTAGASITGSFVLTATFCGIGDTWTAVSDSPRLQITSAASGNGATVSNTIRYSMFTNSTTQTRVAHITVVGQTFTVTQAPSTEPQLNRVVRALYQTILGREPDAAGFAFWTGPGAPRDANNVVLVNQMADGFYRSPEFANSGWVTLSIYQAVFGRMPVFSQWLQSATQIRAGSLTAAQLTDQLTAGTSDANFVQQAISNSWGRQATPAEVAQYAGQLSSGRTRFDFLNNTVFADGQFQVNTNPQFISALYYTILVRDVDQGGLNFWLGIAGAPPGQQGIYYVAPPPPANPAYGVKLAIIGQAVPPNPNLLGFLGSPEFQGLIQ